jgi:uncharacterized membrane protein
MKQTAEIKRYQKVIYAVILAISILWCAAILIAPLWHDSDGIRGEISEYTYTFFSKSCHQIDERSLHFGGNKLGMCSRCTFIYFAFLLGVIIYPLVRKLNNLDLPSLLFLGIGAGLVAADAGFNLFDVFESSFISREITGAILGIILPFYIIQGTFRIF